MFKNATTLILYSVVAFYFLVPFLTITVSGFVPKRWQQRGIGSQKGQELGRRLQKIVQKSVLKS